MIRVKNEITEKDIAGNVNAQLIKPLAIRFSIGLALLVIGIVLLVLNVVVPLGIILSIIGGLFCILLIVMYFIVKSSAKKQNNLGDKMEFEYRFDPRFFSVTVYKKGKKQGVMNLNYQDIGKYKETKDKFFIYLKDKQTLIVSKTVRYPEGSPEALHRILKERVK